MKEAGTLLFLAANAWLDIRKRQVSLLLAVLYGTAGILHFAWQGEGVWKLFPGLAIGMFFIFASLLSRGKLGMGDGLLLAALGTVLEVRELFLTVGIGLFVSALWAAVLMGIWKKGRNTEIPFVPFLLLGYLGGMCL